MKITIFAKQMNSAAVRTEMVDDLPQHLFIAARIFGDGASVHGSSRSPLDLPSIHLTLLICNRPLWDVLVPRPNGESFSDLRGWLIEVLEIGSEALSARSAAPELGAVPLSLSADCEASVVVARAITSKCAGRTA
jgi:hypothetical protein